METFWVTATALVVDRAERLAGERGALAIESSKVVGSLSSMTLFLVLLVPSS